MSLKKHYSEKARLLNDKAVEKIANTEGNYIANNWYGEWETGGAVWFDYSLETGKWMEAYSKLVDGSPVNVEIQTVPLTEDIDLNEIEQLINAGLAYYTDNPHLCISISPSALNPDPFTPIATRFDFINLFPLEPENISIATPAKHAIDTGTTKPADNTDSDPADTINNEPKNTTGNAPIDKSDTAKPANTGKPTDNADKSNVTDSNPTDINGDTAKPIDKPENTGNKTDATSPASKPADDTDNATPKTTAKTADINGDTAKPTVNDNPTNTSKPNVTTADNEPKASSADTNSKPKVTDSDPNSAKPVKPANTSDNEPIDTGKTTDNDPKTVSKPANNSSTSTAEPTDNGSKADDTTPIKTTNTEPTDTTPKSATTPAPSTTDTDTTPKTANTDSNTSEPSTTDTNTNTADKTAPTPIKTTDKASTTGNSTPTDTDSSKTTDSTPKPTATDTDSNTSNPVKPSTTDTTPKTTGDKSENSTAPAKPTDTDSTTTDKTNNVTPLDPPTITDVYQPVTPLYSQDGSLPTPPSNTIDQLLNVLMAQGVFSNDTVLSGTLQDFGVTTGGATQWANAGNQQIGAGYMGQLWFTPFGQQTITDLSNNGYIWTDTTGTDYSDDDDALITFNSVTTEQSPIAGVMENTEWVKGTTWEQIPKTEIPFKTLSADSLLCQMIQSGNVILWKKNVKPNGADMIAALPTQTFTDYLGNKWTAPLAN